MQGTMQKVTNNSGDGYCTMPDGTIMQWGNVGSYQSTKRRDFTVNFPISFTANTTYVVMATSRFASESEPYECLCIVNKVNGSRCVIHQVNPTDNYCNALNWFAVGR